MAKNNPITINFIQDVATPHNNVLLKVLNQDEKIKLNIWYSVENNDMYGWTRDLTNEIKPANIYGNKKINWNLIIYAIKHPKEKFFIVGWTNPSTRVLVLLFWIIRRPFNMWFDRGHDKLNRGRIRHYFRKIALYILRTANARIFCVSIMTKNYFLKRRFNSCRMRLLPIYVDNSISKEYYIQDRIELFKKYEISKYDFIVTSGSRLVYEKGYDLLIKAINFLSDDIREHIKVLIIGKGEEKKNLNKLINSYNLRENIFIEEWMDIEEFKTYIANSDIFVHPARWDAYGNAIYGILLGVPVVCSKNSGAVDQVINGENGFIFNPNNYKELSSIISDFYNNREMLARMSNRNNLNHRKDKDLIFRKVLL